MYNKKPKEGREQKRERSLLKQLYLFNFHKGLALNKDSNRCNSIGQNISSSSRSIQYIIGALDVILCARHFIVTVGCCPNTMIVTP